MTPANRVISLDAFRGFTIASMILVNNPGSWGNMYAPLTHKPWHGITPTDLIFPFFIFIVGVSIALAYTKRLQGGSPTRELFHKIIWRSVKIYSMGILLGLYHRINATTEGSSHLFWVILVLLLMGIFVMPEQRFAGRRLSFLGKVLPFVALVIMILLLVFRFTDMRLVGVLQRIALVFLVCAILFLTTSWKTQAVVGGIILVTYWIVMMFIPTPGQGRAMLEPGVNMAAWIDTFITPGRLYQKTWDPEGIFSTIPAIVTGISGMLAGRVLVTKIRMEEKIIWLFTAGFLAATLGVIWSWHFPLNKSLWTSSFVLATTGLATMTLAASLFLVDHLGYKKVARPWVIFGSNAIAIFVGAGLIGYLFNGIPIGGIPLKAHIYGFFITLGMVPKLASLLFALFYIGFLFIPACILYRKKIFIKL